MSGSFYILNNKYNSLLALIASGGGGGGGVNNPMTSDLNAGGFDIFNATDINAIDLNASADATANRVIGTSLVQGAEINATDILSADNFNKTSAPSYANLGAIAPPNQYEVATIDAATAEGTILGVLRGIDVGFKQTIFFQVISYGTKSVIRILNNVAESDTPIFSEISYGQDATNPAKNSILFTCSAVSATCECAFYQNGGDKGTIGAYGASFVPATFGVVASHAVVYATTPIVGNTSGTSGNFRVNSNLYADDTDTKTLQTNNLATYTNPEIAVNSNLNLQSLSSVKSAASVQTDQLTATTGGGDIRVLSNTDFGNNLLLNSLDDFINIDENIDLQAGHGIVNLTALTGTNGGADAIVMNSDVNMSNNAISNVDNIKTDNIFENTLNNGITIHNETSMSNQKIINLAVPTANSDAATKQYVDTTAGSSGVQNPMTSDLDGGLFNITNTQNITGQTLQNTDGGNMFSKGTFQHGGLAIGDFGVGGDTITFAPSTSFKVKNFGLSTTYFDYDQATQTLTTENGARQELATGSVMEVKVGASISVATGGVVDASVGGSVLINQTAAPPLAGLGEISLLDIQGIGRDGLLQANTLVGGAVIPSAFGCSVMINKRLDATILPFNSGTSWDNSNDGTLILFEDSNSLIYKEGLPAGVDNNDNNPIVFDGWIVGIGANNSSNLGGWTCSGGATIEVVSVSQGSFPIPVILGSAGAAGQGFSSENIIIPQAGWIRADQPQLGGQELAIRLNIPPGDTIDIQNIKNAAVNMNVVVLQQIPIT
jgi:hypothetical protein